jgi:alpha-N-arabinofuranosidase
MRANRLVHLAVSLAALASTFAASLLAAPAPRAAAPATTADAGAARTFTNPILPGFNPDPSVVRVGGDYYLATSSFAYAPGVPIYHSRDLVNWRLVGHALAADPTALPLAGAGLGSGIWAPTLRHHRGTFYLVTTNMTKGGNLLVTAKNPAGPWSKPIWFDPDGWDPSLFFDDDGKVYLSRNGKVGESDAEGWGILQYEIDPRTGKRLSAPRIVWKGSGGFGPEAPHLYKIRGQYYLLIAEGGTHAGHMATIARGPTPWGPFEPAPRNPILSHRDVLLERIQATGHGDLVEAHDGSWWMVFLGIRNTCGPLHMCHLLGRETFLAPVRFGEDGWPVVNEGRPVKETMPAPALPPRPWPPAPARDGFDGPRLGLAWNFLRNPPADAWSLTKRKGHLTLQGSAETLDGRGAPAFVGRRQEQRSFVARAKLDFAPAADGDEAGLTAFQDEKHHYDLAIVRRAGARVAIVRRTVDDLKVEVATAPVPEGPVVLELAGARGTYVFAVGEGQARKELARAGGRLLSTEIGGGFTGVHVAMYATGNGAAAKAPAQFDWFDWDRGVAAPPR